MTVVDVWPLFPEASPTSNYVVAHCINFHGFHNMRKKAIELLMY